MANRKHVINLHTSASTVSPGNEAGLKLGEIAVQHTIGSPALWIKMGSGETSEIYEKFIGESEILELISSNNILGSGYTYSGLPYVNSSTTIADAFSAVTNEMIANERVVAEAVIDLNDKIVELSAVTSGYGERIDVLEISAATNLDLLELSGVVQTKDFVVAQALNSLNDRIASAASTNDVIGLSAATVAVKTGLNNLSNIALTGVSLNNTPLTATNHNASVPVTVSGSGIASASATGSVADAKAVKEYVESVLSSSVDYKSATGSTPTSATKGDLYIASADFMIGSEKVETGDFIIYNGTSWDIIQKNLDGAITGSLTANTVILGDSVNSIKSLANGTAGQVLKMGSSAPEWGDLPTLSSATTGAGNVVSSIQVNGHEITYVKDFTAATNADLTSLSASVVTNGNNITAVSASVVTNKNNVTALSASVVTNATNILTLSGLVEGIFWAKYGIDTWETVYAAYQAGKAVGVKIDDGSGFYTVYYLMSLSNNGGEGDEPDAIIFGSSDPSYIAGLELDNTGEWRTMSSVRLSGRNGLINAAYSGASAYTAVTALSASVVTNKNNVTALSASVIDNKNEISAVSIDLTVLSGIVIDNELVTAQALISLNDKIASAASAGDILELSGVVQTKDFVVAQALNALNNDVDELSASTVGVSEDLTKLSGATKSAETKISGLSAATVSLNETVAEIDDKVNIPVAQSIPATGLKPNVFYNLGELTANTTFTLAAPESQDIVNHYYWAFDIGTSVVQVTWPTGLTWYSGAAPVLSANKHYEVSVINNVAVAMEV